MNNADDTGISASPVKELFPRRGWWTNNNKLGFFYQAAQLSEDTPITILKTDEVWFPHVWTVSLWTKVKVPIPDGTEEGLTRALIEFGVGGATQEVEVDFLRGTTISLVTNSINVRITKVPHPNITVYAQASLGARGGCAVPQRAIAENVTVATANSSAVFELPAFANLIALLPGGSGAATLATAGQFLEIASDPGFLSVIAQYEFSSVLNFYGGKAPIPSRGAFCRVRNTSGGNSNFTLLGLLTL